MFLCRRLRRNVQISVYPLDGHKKEEVGLEKEENSGGSGYKDLGMYRVPRNIIVKCIKFCQGLRK